MIRQEKIGQTVSLAEWVARGVVKGTPELLGFIKLTMEALSPNDKAKVIAGLNHFPALNEHLTRYFELPSGGKRCDYDGTLAKGVVGMGDDRESCLGGLRIEGGLVVTVDPHTVFCQIFFFDNSGNITGCNAIDGDLLTKDVYHFDSKTGRCSEVSSAPTPPEDLAEPVAVMVKAYKEALSKIGAASDHKQG